MLDATRRNAVTRKRSQLFTLRCGTFWGGCQSVLWMWMRPDVLVRHATTCDDSHSPRRGERQRTMDRQLSATLQLM